MIVQPDLPVILASASPRRKELLERSGLQFKVIPAHINETKLKDETPVSYVCRLSEEKGKAISEKYPQSIIISSDTMVLFDKHILGKPLNKKDAYRMLRLLSGKTHEVVTAFTILLPEEGGIVTAYEKTSVRFRDLKDDEILDYIAGGSPMDKAGSYGIQDLNANFVEGINGCFYNVIGFPIALFKKTWDRLFPA